MRITVCIRPGRQGGVVQAYCPELLGCSGVGRSEEEAISLLKKRIESCLGRRAPAAPATRQLTIDI